MQKITHVVVAVLVGAGLAGLAANLLYNPHPDQPTQGEYDGTALVPMGLVRAALDRAGGAQPGPSTDVRGAEVPIPAATVASDAAPSGGATMGPTMLAAFKDQLCITDDGWTWQHGDTDREWAAVEQLAEALQPLVG